MVCHFVPIDIFFRWELRELLNGFGKPIKEYSKVAVSLRYLPCLVLMIDHDVIISSFARCGIIGY